MSDKHEFNPTLVSQNRCYISYKTMIYGQQLSFFVELAKAFTDYLKEKKIPFKEGTEQIRFAEGRYRSNRITVMVTMVDGSYDADGGKYFDLDFEQNAIE